MDKTIKRKLLKKYSKELEACIAEKAFLETKIAALSKIKETIEKTEET